MSPTRTVPLTPLERRLLGAAADALTMDPRYARSVWAQYRYDHGRTYSAPSLFTAPDHQPKTNRNTIPTWVLHLAPARVSGINTCPMSTPGCRAGCLNTAGRGTMTTVQDGRILRTQFAYDHPAEFLCLLYHGILGYRRRRGAIGIRLNGTSDIRWEVVAPFLFDITGVTFYDYTKIPGRSTPHNYALTYSVSERERTAADVRARALEFGRLAVVVDIPAHTDAPLPAEWCGLPVVDGDETDWRLEPGTVVVALRAKGDIRTTTGKASGFVKPAAGLPA